MIKSWFTCLNCKLICCFHNLQNTCSFKNVHLKLWKHVTYFSHTCINEEQLSDILILFQVHFLNNFKTQLDARIQFKVGCCKAEKQSQWFRTRGRVETAFLWIHGGYWLISLRLRSELAQLVMRLHSWMLVSTEAELCNWLVAQRSLVRTASSASWSMFWMAVLGGLTGGRAGARTGVEDGVKGEGAAGGGKVARPPAAAPSQCSGLGTDTLAWLPLVLGPPLSSEGAAWAGGWAASCRSLTCDKAACAFSAGVGKRRKR